MVSVSSSDVCVVGGGVIGLAAAASLCDRGVDVVCFDRSDPGQGQSAGRTRQFRHLHGSAELVELAVQARRHWLEWEGRFGLTLLGSEGALRVGGEPGELDALRAAGIPAVALDPEPAQALLPVAALPGASLLWDPLAGAIRASDTVQALSDFIGPRVSQAEVRSVSIHADGESVDVLTANGVHRSARCLVCAGAGTDRLVRPLGLEVMQDRQAHLRLAFRTRVPASRPLPCFSDRSGQAAEQIYALSDLGDRYAVGLAPVTTYPAVEDLAVEVPAGVSVAAQRDRIVAYVRRALPGLDPEPVDAVLRLTTTLPDHPEDGFEVWCQGPVITVAGPNLFKFAPVIGERLAATVSEQQPVARPVSAASRIARTAPGPRRLSR